MNMKRMTMLYKLSQKFCSKTEVMRDAMSDRNFCPRGPCRLSVSQALATLLICSGLSLSTLTEPQARVDFSHGAITDKVICMADPTQSYALYLPSAYAPQRNW